MKAKLLLLFSFFTAASFSQKLPEIDLSKNLNADETVIDLNCGGFKILNKLPDGMYQYKISVTESMIKLPEYTASSGASLAGGDPCADIMKDYIKAYNDLLNEKDEKNVEKWVKALNTEKKKLVEGDNKQCYDQSEKKADELIIKTSESRNFDFTLKKGQTITILINRLSGDGTKVEKTWTVVFKTPDRIDFLSHFGFTFSPGFVKRPTHYFAKQGANDQYVITEMNDNGPDFWDDLSLTANFIFPFGYQKNPDEPLHFAWMGGFGINGDAKFTVFTGPCLLLSDFTSIGIGFGVSNQYKLNGQYKPGDVITENLNFDQLHSRGLVGDILITLTFRLSKTQLQAKTK